MEKKSILVIDDEEDIIELVQYHLKREGYRVLRANTGEDGLTLAQSGTPDLVILDLMLPGIDGLEVCKRLKNNIQTEKIPIIMLSAKGEEIDIVTGLELGADDYVTKPFSPRILLARVRSVLRQRRRQIKSVDIIKVHDLVINRTRHEVLASGVPIELTITEFRTLELLARRPGQVFTRDQIMDKVRGYEYVATDRNVDVQIVSLRKKLGTLSRAIA